MHAISNIEMATIANKIQPTTTYLYVCTCAHASAHVARRAPVYIPLDIPGGACYYIPMLEIYQYTEKKKEKQMADEVKEKNVFDIEFETPPEKGKACHMQIDEDLHTFLKREHIKLGVKFRKLANELLCKGIQQYIKAKKMPNQIRDRSKF